MINKPDRFAVRLIRVALLYFVYVFSARLFQGFVDPPDPADPSGSGWSWFLSEVRVSFGTACWLVAQIVVVVAMHMLLVQVRGESLDAKELAYYPRLQEARRMVSSVASRLILIIGLLGLVCYWGLTMIDIWQAERWARGLLWPPDRVLSVFMGAWGILWLAQATQRARRATLGAAIGFIIISVLFAMGQGRGALVE